MMVGWTGVCDNNYTKTGEKMIICLVFYIDSGISHALSVIILKVPSNSKSHKG